MNPTARTFRYVCTVLVALIGPTAIGQTVSRRIRGSVVDPSGAVVPDAEITLVNDSTKAASIAKTETASGFFVFPSIPGGTYSLHVKAQGFKSVQVQNVQLTSSEIRDVGAITLQVGGISERAGHHRPATVG